MRGMWTGLGVTFGAAFGLVVGLLVFDGSWWAPIAGAGLGIVIGAVADSFRNQPNGRD